MDHLTDSTPVSAGSGTLTSPRGAPWHDRIFPLVNLIFLIILAATMIVPFLNVLAVSVSGPLASSRPGIHLWPESLTFDGFRIVWVNVGLERAFINSVIVTAIGTTLHVILAALAGYVLIQRELPGKKLIVAFIIGTMAVPGELIMIPLYVVMKQVHLYNTLGALIVSGLVSGFSILLMRNFFAGVPYDLAESARIDGANDLRIFTNIYLPLSKAGIATIALFELVGRWNQFLQVILFINDSSKYTLQVALQTLVTENMSTSGTSMVTPNVRMAGIIIAILPLIAIYPFMQKYFVQGISLGAVKE